MPLPTTSSTSTPFIFLPTTPFPTPSTILLIQTHLSHHLPPELVDLILNHAEFWAHSTTTTPLNQPVRAFGPFTWGWGRSGGGNGEGEDRIDYLNVWCPAGPGYAHRWRRWGESRRDDGFVMRSGPIGLLADEDDEEREVGGQLRSSSRYLLKKKVHRVGRCIRSLWKKGTVAAAAGLLRMYHRCQKCSERETTKTTITTMNEISAPHPSSRRRTAAVRKIVFETWSHQDYFGAVGDDSAADDDDDEQRGGAQHSITPRLFCDVTINRRMIKGRDDARSSTFSCWKGRVRRWRWWRIGNSDISDTTDNNDDGNDKDADDKKKKKDGKSDSKHPTLISHKPIILSTTSHPRSYHPTYHINTWRWDSSSSSSSNSSTIKPNNNNTIKPHNNTIKPHNNTSFSFPTAQDFLRRIEVGDTIGIWGRVGRGETYHIIDAMRMHVFWAV